MNLETVPDDGEALLAVLEEEAATETYDERIGPELQATDEHGPREYAALVNSLADQCANVITAWHPDNSELDYNLHSQIDYLRRSANKVVVSHLDTLMSSLYIDIILTFSDIDVWKDREDGDGQAMANVIPYNVALDIIEEPKQVSHIADCVKEFFDCKEEELSVVSIDMGMLGANSIINKMPWLTPHSANYGVETFNLLLEEYGDGIPGLKPKVDNLNDIKLYEYNLLVHLIGAVMTYGYIYILDFSDSFCTYVCKTSPPEFKDCNLPTFSEAMSLFMDSYSHLVRNPVSFNSSYSMSHGVLEKAVEMSVMASVLERVNNKYVAVAGVKRQQEITELKMQMKNAMNGATNAFGWE